MPKPLIDKPESRHTRAQIRHVLLHVWDPIGVHDEPNAQDEYDGYIGELYELLTGQATNLEIHKYLYWVAHTRMGFEHVRASDTAKTIAALRTITISR